MSEMIFDSNLSFAAILIKFHKHDYGDKIEKLIHFIILTSIYHYLIQLIFSKDFHVYTIEFLKLLLVVTPLHAFNQKNLYVTEANIQFFS